MALNPVLQLQTPAIFDSKFITGLRFPDIEGFAGYWELEGTLDRARTNLITNVKAAVTGSPLVEADGVTFTGGANYLTSDIADSIDFFWLIVGKVVTSEGNLGTSMFMSNYNSVGGAFGSSLFASSSGSYPAGTLTGTLGYTNATPAGATQQRGIATPDIGVWTMLSENIQSVEGAGSGVTPFFTVTNHTSGDAPSNGAPNTPRQLGLSPRIGASYNNSFAGKVKMLRALAVNKAVDKNAALPELLAFVRRQLSFDHSNIPV